MLHFLYEEWNITIKFHPIKHKGVNKVKSRQFPNLEEAIAYLKERGELKLWGREGMNVFVYTLTIGSKVFHLLVHENGNVRVIDETYK